MRASLISIYLPAALGLAACGGAAADDEDGLTAAEERQLDEAAERLDREREAYEAEMTAQARSDAAAAAQAENGDPAEGGDVP